MFIHLSKLTNASAVSLSGVKVAVCPSGKGNSISLAVPCLKYRPCLGLLMLVILFQLRAHCGIGEN
jgi:hypothetical protein